MADEIRGEPVLARLDGAPGGLIPLSRVVQEVEAQAGYLSMTADALRVGYGALVHFLGSNGYSDLFFERYEEYREDAAEAALFRLVRQGNAAAAVFWAERAERRGAVGGSGGGSGGVESGDAPADLALLLEDAARRVPALGWKLYEALGRVLDEVDPGMRERPMGMAPRGMSEAMVNQAGQGPAHPGSEQAPLPQQWHLYCPDGEGMLGVPLGWYGEVAYRSGEGLVPEALSMAAALSYRKGAVIRLVRAHDGWVPRSKERLPEMTVPKNLVYIVS